MRFYAKKKKGKQVDLQICASIAGINLHAAVLFPRFLKEAEEEELNELPDLDETELVTSSENNNATRLFLTHLPDKN